MAVMQASEASINFVKTRLASPDGKLWGKAPGMVLLKPTSIAYSGTSATLGTNGQVTFNAVTSLSLNGVFTSGFDNYFISLRDIPDSGASNNLRCRLRASGVDTTGSDYTVQYIYANGTSVTSARITAYPYFLFTNISSTYNAGDSIAIFGPALAQPTAMRTFGVDSTSGATIIDLAGTHSLSTSYDGFTLEPNVVNITGALQVYGVRS